MQPVARTRKRPTGSGGYQPDPSGQRPSNPPRSKSVSRQHPVNDVQWVDPFTLHANDYNPNVVQTTEMRLLEHSLLTTGWIQPILAGSDRHIIDGYHRTTLARASQAVLDMADGKVPVCFLDVSDAERRMLTIRINRAKGSHVAFRMADVVKSLVKDHGLSVEDVMKGIGASRPEVELLLQDSVFKKLEVEKHPYSQAWYPA